MEILLEQPTNTDTKTCINTVKDFIRKTWEHPLVTNATRKHRALGLKEAEYLLDSNGLLYSCGIPAGSSIWIPDDLSDFDIIFISRLQSEAKTLEFADNNGLKKRTGIHILENINLEPSFSHETYEFFHLLITPDEYIAGNVEFARNLRMDVVNKLAAMDNIKGLWNGRIEALFDRRYKSWKQFEPEETPWIVRKILGKRERSREVRFNNALDERAKQSHAPNVWKSKFLEALKKFELPDFETYERAIKATNGELSISQTPEALWIPRQLPARHGLSSRTAAGGKLLTSTV